MFRSCALTALLLLSTTGCAARGWFAGRSPALQSDRDCPKLDDDATGPVVVLVPGIGGDIEKVQQVHEALDGLSPRAIVTFRWSAFENTTALVERFAGGVNQLDACTGEVPLLVLAHSAGGVIASLAADRLESPEPEAPPVVVITVASPLGGVDRASARAEWFQSRPFALQLGMKIRGYPAPQPGVRYVHVRTHPKGDEVMRPAPTGHRPDDPRAVVPGAHEHSLPENVGHDEALVIAARKLVDAPKALGLEAFD